MQTPYEMLQGWGGLYAGSRWLYGPLDFFKLVCQNECMFDIFRNKPHKSSPTPRDAEGQSPVTKHEKPPLDYSRITSELTRATRLLDEDRAERIAEEQEYQRERAEAIRRRTEFLKKTESAPASPKLYALWLWAYMAQGGKITHPRGWDFPQSHIEKGDSITQKALATIGPNGSTFEDRTISYYDQPSIIWTPTKDSDNHKTPYTIPTGYGLHSMKILYLPDLVTLNTRATSGDRRPGQEYGHSTLLTLQLDDTSPTGFHATTNQPDTVESYIDTTDLIMGVSGDFDPEIMRSNIQQIQQLQHENTDDGWTDDGWSELLSC